MNEETRRALLATNAAFYEAHGAAFAQTRSIPWAGWNQVAHFLPERAEIADLGCGHGRFAAYLAERPGPPPMRYLGIDGSAALLSLAAQRAWPTWVEFSRGDFMRDSLSACLAHKRFDVVCLFGVLHHVPGRLERTALLDAALGSLRPGGVVVVTLWRFDESPRFARRRLDPAIYGPRMGIEPTQLETGDTLLGFGMHDDPPRYCHFPSEGDIVSLTNRPGARLRLRFRPPKGDTLNEYLILTRQEG